jgi:hypothetical protein
MSRAANRRETGTKTPRRAKRSREVRFPEVVGKTLEFVELWLEDDDESYIELCFSDHTALVFAVRPYPGVKVSSEYGNWKDGNWRGIKTWPGRTSGKAI